MEMLIGVALVVVGLLLFFAGRSKSKKIRVEATNGSVAVGGDNSGSIINANIGAPASAPAPHGTHWLTVVGIVVELIGIAVVLWHAWHMAAVK